MAATAHVTPALEEPLADAEASIPRSCPRCAYDLMGVINSWKDACPLHGTCSECGLAFQWRDIFDDELSGPPWSFEHAPRWSWRRLVWTIWKTMWPFQSWRELRMEVPIVRRRLLALPLVIYAVFHVTLGLVACVDVFGDAASIAVYGVERVFLIDALPALVWPYAHEYRWFDGTVPLAWACWVGMQWLFMPLLMLIMGETMRRSRVRQVHILRGACCSAGCAAAATALALVLLLPSLFSTYVSGGWLAMAALTPTLWLGVWWHRYLKNYLRLPRAWLITLVLLSVGLFATFTLMFAGASFLVWN